MIITDVGLGYVGLSNASLLARRHSVTTLDISENRVNQIGSGISPIADTELEAFLAAHPGFLKATTDAKAHR